MAVNLTGFVLGQALARDKGVSDDEATRAGLVAALMPSPLVGAIIVESLERDATSRPTHTPPTHAQIEHARKQAIAELERVLEELRHHPPR